MPSQAEDFRNAVRDLLTELKSNRAATDAQLDVLQRRLDAIPDRIDITRRELLGILVTRAEYEPKHQFLLDKVVRYDTILDDRIKAQEERSDLRAAVKQHAIEIDEMKKRTTDAPGRIMQYVAIGIAVVSFLVNVASHIRLN